MRGCFHFSAFRHNEGWCAHYSAVGSFESKEPTRLHEMEVEMEVEMEPWDGRSLGTMVHRIVVQQGIRPRSGSAINL